VRLSNNLSRLQSFSCCSTSAHPSVRPDLTLVTIAWPIFRSAYLSASGPYCLVLRQSAAYPAANRRVAHIRTTRRRKPRSSDLSLCLLPTRDIRKQCILPSCCVAPTSDTTRRLPPPCPRFSKSFAGGQRPASRTTRQVLVTTAIHILAAMTRALTMEPLSSPFLKCLETSRPQH
jgi:hypothetical protein